MSQNSGAGIVEIGIQRLLAKYPLFGGLVATWTVIEDATIPTMAIGLGGSGFNLYYNSHFVRRLPIDLLVGVLHHEARHVIYGHVFMDPAAFPDEEALVIAQEVTVNEKLPEPLPKGVIRLKDYPQLKPNTDTETRYRRLAKKTHSSKPDITGAAGQQPNDSKKNENGATRSAGAPSGSQVPPPACANPSTSNNQAGSPSKQSGTGNGGAGSAQSSSNGNGGGNSSSAAGTGSASTPSGTNSSTGGQNGSLSKGTKTPVPIDDHSRWREVREQESFAKAILDSTIRDIIEKNPNLSPPERMVVEKSIRQRGVDPGNYFSEIQQVKGRSTLNWRALLQRYTGQELSPAPMLSWPPRRHPHLVGIMPGNARAAERPKILAVVDTSQSMSDSIIAEIVKELRYLARDHSIWVVECDAAVQRAYRYSARIKLVQGRGGTDFRPPLKPKFLRRYRPDLVIFFTDGEGPAPKNAPQVPVIWVLTPEGEAPVKWGRVIKMEKTSAK